MSISDIINTIIALTTVFSLIVIWLTLREMKVQRIKSFQPIIIPLNFKLLFICEYPEKILPITYIVKENSDKVIFENSIGFEVANLGQGLAKEIEFTLINKMDFTSIFTFINDKLKELGIDLKMDINEKSCWIPPNDFKKINIGGNFPFTISSTTKIDYLIPINKIENKYFIKFASTIGILIQLSILLIEATNDNNKHDIYSKIKEFMNFGIVIKYKDNLNNTFEINKSIYLESISKQIKGIPFEKIYSFKFQRR